jgi:hypothetical protein
MSTDLKICYYKEVIKGVQHMVTKTLTFAEETEVISSLYTAVAYLKQMRDVSISNRDYWEQRVEETQHVADKFYAELKASL